MKYLLCGFFITLISASQVVLAAKPILNNPKADSSNLTAGNTTQITAAAADIDNKELFYTWKASLGTITGDSKTVTYKAPDFVPSTVEDTITVQVSNGEESVQKTTKITIAELKQATFVSLKDENNVSESTVELGTSKNLTLFVSPNGNQIETAEIEITYDPIIIEVPDTNQSIDGVQVSLTEQTQNIKNNHIFAEDGNPLHHIALKFDFKEIPITETPIATIPLKVKSTSNSSTISIKTAILKNNGGKVFETTKSNYKLNVNNPESVSDFAPTIAEEVATDITTTLVEPEPIVEPPTPTPIPKPVRTEPVKPTKTLHSAATESTLLSDTGVTTNIAFLATAIIMGLIFGRRLLRKLFTN